MDKEVIKVLRDQKLFDWYFDNRNLVLLSVILLSIFASIYMIRKNEQMLRSVEYKEIWGKTFAHTIIAIIIATGVNAAGLKLKFDIDHMPILLLSSALLITTGIQIVECIRFRKNCEEVIKRTNNIYIVIIESVFLLVSIMGRLEIIELAAVVIGSVTLKTINIFIDSCIKVPHSEEANIDSLSGDFPIVREEDLFRSRRHQLDNLCKELDQFSGEPFAVAISGKWGSGKTSFVKVLKKKINQVNQAEFVEIECGIEYDVKAVLKDIALQMQEIYKRNNVYTGKNGVIEKYFEKIGEFLDNTGYSAVTKVLDKMQIKENNSYMENKAAINEELNMFYRLTEKRIYFIVDDMDRIIDDEMRAVVFQVVRESVSLNNCITLFMIDYDRLISECMSKEFLEKYVNRYFELCNIEFEEIVDQYETLFLSDTFWDGKSDYITERGKKLKKDIVKNGLNIYYSIQSKIEELQENRRENKDASEEEKDVNRQYLEWLMDAEERLQDRMRNPRKVKRYLNDVEKKLTVADTMWFQNTSFDSNEYSKENWIEIIHETAFLKIFLYEEYDALIKAQNFRFFKRDEKSSYIAEFVLSGFGRWYTLSKRKEAVTEMIVYRLYALDIDIDKTEHQKLIEELDTDALQERNLNLYIVECMGINFNYQGAEKILDYLENHNFRSQRDKCDVIVNIMSIISGDYNLYARDLSETMKKIKSIIDAGRTNAIFNEKERNLIEHYIQLLQKRFVYGNKSNIRMLLGILYDAELNEYFYENLDTISQLHDSIIKIYEVYHIPEFNRADTEIDTLDNYFQVVKEIFSGQEYQYAEQEIMYFFEKVIVMLEILKIWFGKTENTESEPEQYYDSARGEFKDTIFESAESIIKGLSEIESYVSVHPEDGKPGEAFIQLVSEMEVKEAECPDYLGEDKKGVIIALSDTYEKLKENQAISRASGDRWIFCKIRLFRLRRNNKI